MPREGEDERRERKRERERERGGGERNWIDAYFFGTYSFPSCCSLRTIIFLKITKIFLTCCIILYSLITHFITLTPDHSRFLLPPALPTASRS